MKRFRLRPAALALVIAFGLSSAFAQQTPPAPASSETVKPATKTFSQQELDQLLAPIALYPDALLAQVLMASTYPLEVVAAARWSTANPKVSGKALEDAMAQQSWDPSVKSLTSVPQVLKQMDEKIDWTQKLGDAFLAQQQDVMSTVQTLRAKADAAGNLKSSEQMTVKKESQASETIYIIESPKPEVVYVPTYNPTVVYGTWWYPAPPYYMYPPSYVYPPGLAFATGVIVGAAIWGSCNWGWGGHHDVDVNINKYNNFNRTNISNKNWNHNVNHRGGVAYRDQGVANKFNRGGNVQNTAAREQFRGRAEAGRTELRGMDRNELNDRVNSADRQSNRGDFGGRGGDGVRGSGERGGFSGMGNGASTREASARGSASRADMGNRGSGGGNRSFSGSGGGGARTGARSGGGGRGRR